MGKYESSEPEALAARVRSGSAEAIRELRSRVRTILHFRGYRIPPEDRKDLEQEIMTQVWQAVNRSGFDPTLGFSKFVEVVTVRRCIDWLRARRDESELPTSLAASGGPERSALASERQQLVHAALARLDKPCRDLIYLRVGMNRSYRQIARELGRSEGALRVQLHRCIRRVRDVVAEMSGEVDPSEKGAEHP